MTLDDDKDFQLWDTTTVFSSTLYLRNQPHLLANNGQASSETMVWLTCYVSCTC